MFKKISLAAALAVAASLFFSCGGKSSDCGTVTFDSYVKTLVAQKCSLSGCHDGNVDTPGDYRTFAGVQKNINSGKFKTEVLEKNRMPLGSS